MSSCSEATPRTPGVTVEVSTRPQNSDDALRRAARTDQIVADGKEIENVAAGFLDGFPPGHRLGGFARMVDNPGDNLQQPGTAGKFQRADPELFQ